MIYHNFQIDNLSEYYTIYFILFLLICNITGLFCDGIIYFKNPIFFNEIKYSTCLFIIVFECFAFILYVNIYINFTLNILVTDFDI
jgi:hypothetical protein